MNSESKNNRSLLDSIDNLEKVTSKYSTEEKESRFNAFKSQPQVSQAAPEALFDNSLSKLINVCIEIYW